MPRKKPKRKPKQPRLRRPEVRPAGPPIPVELLNEIPIEPELMAEALDSIANASADGPLTSEEVMLAAVSTYAGFYEHDDENPISPEQVHEMVALARRMIALTETLPRLNLTPSPDSFLAMAAAACTARLIEKDGVATFQPLDFLSAFERAKARRA